MEPERVTDMAHPGAAGGIQTSTPLTGSQEKPSGQLLASAPHMRVHNLGTSSSIRHKPLRHWPPVSQSVPKTPAMAMQEAGAVDWSQEKPSGQGPSAHRGA